MCAFIINIIGNYDVAFYSLRLTYNCGNAVFKRISYFVFNDISIAVFILIVIFTVPYNRTSRTPIAIPTFGLDCSFAINSQTATSILTDKSYAVGYCYARQTVASSERSSVNSGYDKLCVFIINIIGNYDIAFYSLRLTYNCGNAVFKRISYSVFNDISIAVFILIVIYTVPYNRAISIIHHIPIVIPTFWLACNFAVNNQSATIEERILADKSYVIGYSYAR